MPSNDPSSSTSIHKVNPTQTSLNHFQAGLSDSEPRPILSLQDDEERAQALLQLSIALIDSGLDILDKHVLDDGQLTKDSVLMPGGTIGKHFRHVIETFQAFLSPLEPHSQLAPPGKLSINYDAILPSSRRSVARSVISCRKAMSSVRQDLEAWGERSRSQSDNDPGTGVAGEQRRIGLAGEMSRKVQLGAITPTKQSMESSVGRELWFCALHAIHHFSMLRTVAVHELGLDLPIEFGTAPSTLLYRGNNWTPPDEKKEVRIVKSKL